MIFHTEAIRFHEILTVNSKENEKSELDSYGQTLFDPHKLSLCLCLSPW